MLELLFLLLPIAAAYGWYMGRRSVRIDQQRESHRLSRNYVAGINFLLSSEPDKAVDLFIELLQVDHETMETHLALGNLFRQRGEVDRAIRIHQNLVARTHLTFEQRNLSMLELARDFIAAGLLDRAETILLELVKDAEHEQSAAMLLIDIYQQMRDWEKAIAIAERVKKQLGDKVVPAMAHYYCELADQELQQHHGKRAVQRLKKALSIDPRCVRASLTLAKEYLAAQQGELVIQTLAQVPEQDADFASEALPLLLRAEPEGEPSSRLTALLQSWLEKTGAASVALALANSLERRDGAEAAELLILRELKRHPTMKGFHRLMSYRLAELDSPKARESLGLLKHLVEEQIKSKPSYRCRHCGFSARLIFWQCPSCKSWGTIKPIRGLDGE